MTVKIKSIYSFIAPRESSVSLEQATLHFENIAIRIVKEESFCLWHSDIIKGYVKFMGWICYFEMPVFIVKEYDAIYEATAPNKTILRKWLGLPRSAKIRVNPFTTKAVIK
jgi:hypothetical protein